MSHSPVCLQDSACCTTYSQALLYHKGYHAIQTHRIAHTLWCRGQKVMAVALQRLMNEVIGKNRHINSSSSNNANNSKCNRTAVGLITGAFCCACTSYEPCQSGCYELTADSNGSCTAIKGGEAMSACWLSAQSDWQAADVTALLINVAVVVSPRHTEC